MVMENWVVHINEQLVHMADTSEEVEQWRKRSIYMLPARVTDLDNKAYKPQAVSLGPYHHDEHHLKPMEEHKHRALLHFIKRSATPLQAYLLALEEVVQELKDAYDQLDLKWLHDTGAFLKLMILDGCFILEIIRMARFDDYAPNDPIFSHHGLLYVLPFLKRDMLLLENQVPLLVLIKLLEVENKKSQPDENVNKLVLKFFNPGHYGGHTGKCLHLLDVYRKSLLYEPHRSRVRLRSRHRYHAVDGDIIPSATELGEAGIRFKRSRTRSLKDISFKGNTLSLPVIVVDEETKSTLLNLIAFERFHVGAGSEVTSYIFFLDSLVKGSKDVSLLRSRGIICNALGTDEDVAKLFNLLRTEVVVDPESSLDRVYRMVSKKLRNRFKKRLHEWQADLVQTYFRSPWAVVSVIAAILLFTLTIIQTVYSVLSYNRQN
ncbi:hypothetical protein Pfo_024332 [Paulownia fortunei]|nr:hypothetical protein Pfo_024332 [Paulownia fortunei]